MTTDLWLLLAAAGWTWLLILLAATPRLLRNPRWSMGNRDKPLEAAAWVKRLERATANMVENLPLFAILVLIAHVAGKANADTTLGAQIFLGARLVHAAVYVAGGGVLRTVAWTVSIGGMGLIVWGIVA